MTFAELWRSCDDELRYQLDERAAIHEYVGTMTREEAENRTVREYYENLCNLPPGETRTDRSG